MDKTFIIHSIYQKGRTVHFKETKVKARDKYEAVDKRRKKAPSQRILRVYEGDAPDLKETVYRFMGGQFSHG